MSLSNDPKIRHFRQQMQGAERIAYFEHAAISPLPRPTCEAIRRWLDEASQAAAPNWPGWDRRLQEVRSTAATMIGASVSEIALIHSTTEGVAMVAEGFDWREGDNVVLPADEFPANQYPWINLAQRGVEARRVVMPPGRVDLAKLEAAIDQRTRIVALSWVGFLSGWRNDLAAAVEMAHRRGALLFVDAIQGLGVFPIDVHALGVDFLAAGGQKWLMGPESAGLLYIREEHLPLVRPLVVGSNSMVHSRRYDQIEIHFKDSAARFEGGAANSVGFIGLGASFDLLMQVGFDTISEQVLAMTDECVRRLRAMDAELLSHRDERRHCSGIVSFKLPGCESEAIRRHCLDQNVAICQRLGYLRISPHGYITDSDVDALFDALTKARQACRS